MKPDEVFVVLLLLACVVVVIMLRRHAVRHPAPTPPLEPTLPPASPSETRRADAGITGDAAESRLEARRHEGRKRVIRQ